VKKRIIIIAVIIVILGATGIYSMTSSNTVEVNAEKVLKGNISEYVEEVGIVKSKNCSTIYSPTAGKISEVLVDVGDKVNKGEVLLRLDSEQLSRQVAELEAQRSAVLAQYNEAKNPSNEENIRKIEIEIENLENRIKTAEKNVNDKEKLYESGAISKEEYESAVRNLDMERNNLRKAILDLEQLKKPVSQNILAQYEAQLKQIDLQIENLRDTGEDYTIVAPISGTVLRKEVEEGSYLNQGMFIMEIGETEELYIETDVLVEDVAKIKERSKVIIYSDELGIDDLKGVVTKIHPTAFSKISDLGIEQKRVKVEIKMENTDFDIKPGYELDLRIIVNSKENALMVPKNSVFEMEDKEYVFIVDNGRAVLKEVKTGIEGQKHIEIVEGLEEGQLVILSPDNSLEDGMKVKSNVR